MQGEIARGRHLRALSNQCIELDKRVKRHGWKAVVLGMVGHPPGQEENRGVGVRCAGIGEHVVNEGAVNVL